jgi:hypothetical protein
MKNQKAANEFTVGELIDHLRNFPYELPIAFCDVDIAGDWSIYFDEESPEKSVFPSYEAFEVWDNENHGVKLLTVRIPKLEI